MSQIFIIIHLLIFIIGLSMLTLRYIRIGHVVFLNLHSLVLFFGIFYISVPGYVTLFFDYSPVFANSETILATSMIGAYFNIIFLICAAFSKYRTPIPVTTSKKPQMLPFYRAVSFLILAYLILVLSLQIDDIIAVSGNRALQSHLNTDFSRYFKIKALFYPLIGSIIVLSLHYRSRGYFLLTMPYVFLDLSLSGRGYLFVILVSYFLTSIFVGKPIKLRYPVFFVLTIASIAVFRTGDVSTRQLVQIVYEFIFTWSTTHLAYDTPDSFNATTAFFYSWLRVFPSIVYSTFFGSYTSYTSITTEANPLGWGLAGSLVAESIIFKNTVIIILFPIFISIFASFINAFLRRGTLSGALLFTLTAMQLQQMFRFSFLELYLYPLYILIFLFPHLWVFDMLNRKKVFNFYKI